MRVPAAQSEPTIDQAQADKPGDSKARTSRTHPVQEPGNKPGLDAPSADDAYQLPGHTRGRCLSQGPLGIFWKLTDAQGRDKRGLWPLQADLAPQTLDLLRGCHHPALPKVEVLWDLSGRLVLVTDQPKRTLRHRYEDCRSAGVPGVPRQELLGYLATAAEALDSLARSSRFSHLNLNPSTLLLEGDKVLLGDFGLTSLLGVPGEVALAEINGRYAAPELYENQATATSDQYSLAIIYAEMLSGVRVRARSSAPRTRARSGHRVETTSNLANPVNLDLVPAFDRPALAKALNTDPKKRFATCTELVTALEEAGSGTRSTGRQRALPSVLPSGRLTGTAAPDPGRPVPGVRKFLEKLAGEANVFLPAPAHRRLRMWCTRTAPGNRAIPCRCSPALWT